MKNLISASILGISAVSLILTGLAVPANATSNLSVPVQVSTVTDVNDASKTELLQRINDHRVASGLKTLTVNSSLVTVAQNWTDKTATAGGFKHNPDFSTQIPQNWKYTGEIIAVGETPEEMFLGWKNSEGHNNIMLETTATEIGIGYAYQGNPAGEYYGNYYATAIIANYGTVAPVAKNVTPIAPVWNTTSFDIPAVTGVQYKVNGVVHPAGTYSGKEITTVTAEALDGYIITGTASWTKTYEIAVIEPLPVVTAVTPVAPTFSTNQYTIPTTTGVQYKVNGTVKSAGSYLGVGIITITATELPGYKINGTATWSKTFVIQLESNPAIKSIGDIITIDASGNLWNYGNLKTSRKKIGTGWQSFNDIHTTDWNKDGFIDIIAKNNAGELYFFKGNNAGSFAKIKLGSGWNNYTLDVIQWNKKLKYPSIIATNVTNGKLYHYANLNGAGVSPQALIGSGWKGLAINALDWDKDGNIDLIVKNAAGQLVLYRTNGAGQFINERRVVIGGGWNPFDTIKVVKNFGGAGTSGLLVRNSAGSLIYYQANKSSWAKAAVVGSGWKGYKIANQ